MSNRTDTLTWKQFKDAVDEQLRDREISENTPLFYIDTGNYPDRDRAEVCYSDEWITIQ